MQPVEATPHHVILIADPQLVDPHTYPGRPWPLSTATMKYTDLYLRKSFKLIQDILDPDTVIFLGDLFDGGREWATQDGIVSDRQWKKYGDNFWLKEYNRFGGIFFEPWTYGKHTERQDGFYRKMIATLPGNHDLGLGTGIRLRVRNRFNAYFGGGNRVDVIGNHSFVSLDTLSLSAKGQSDPATGAMGASGGNELTREIWGPPEEFLSQVKAEKARAISRELKRQVGKQENEVLDHTLFELSDPLTHKVQETSNFAASTDMPSILLTHVPLYRASGTPCGPLRERYPPTKSSREPGATLDKDDRNAIKVEAGVQYQNVLTSSVSNEVVEMIGDVENVFSGDDHDYCEVVHSGYSSRNGGIREITVKSMSWAMGVRKPGFLMVSLWNPVDARGDRVGDTAKGKTLESYLCLLPDQLSIFIRYGFLLGLTVFVLLIRALRVVFDGSIQSTDMPLLPVTRSGPSSPKQETMAASARSWVVPEPKSIRSSSPDRSSYNGLAVRSHTARTRSVSPLNGYGLPPQQPSSLNLEDEYDVFRDGNTRRRKEWGETALHDRSKRKGGNVSVFFVTFKRSVYQVACFALLWYTWLLWNR